MGMFFRNKEIKILIKRLIVAIIILMIMFVFIISRAITNYSYELNVKNYGQIAALLQNHNELEVDIISNLTREPSSIHIEEGRKLAQKYGITKDDKFKNMPYVENILTIFTGISIGFIVISLIVVSIIVLNSIYNVYKHVKIIGIKTEKIIDGNYDNVLNTSDVEGDFAILEHSINRMSSTLKNSMNLLQEEKVILKNILSDISHQLKTPLTSLITFNELMMYGNIEDENIKEDFLMRSNIQLERMEFLVKNLLKMARLEVNAVEFHKCENDIISTIKIAMEELRGVFNEKVDNIHIINSEERINIYHDVSWMKEAISNLVKNALEHSGEEDIIEITIDNNNVFTSILIKDFGEGIHRDDVPHIFKRFYRGKTASNNSIGIGLFLAKSIIENHNGSITCRSNYGKGTEFEIILMNSY
ncbi:MAG: HAMP domain-containing sensor histidine kinase [Clostridium sp.]